MAGELKSEITVLRSLTKTESAASASSRPPGLEGHARSNLGHHERWKDWSMMQKAYMMAGDAENGSLSPRSRKLNAQLCYVLDQFDALIKEYEQCCNDKTECPCCQRKCERTIGEQMKAGQVVTGNGEADTQQCLLERIQEEVLELTRELKYLELKYLQSQTRPTELGAFPGKGMSKIGGGNTGDGSRSNKKCHYCNEAGHLWSECRSRIAAEAAEYNAKGSGGKTGFLLRKAAGANSRVSAQAQDVCNYCHKKGHKEAQCRKKQQDQKPGGPLAATAQATQSEPEPPPTVPIRALQLT